MEFTNLCPSAPPKFLPPLDPEFRPAALENRAFREAVQQSGCAVPLAVGLERGDGLVSVYRTEVFPEGHGLSPANLLYVERMVKTLLWARGGWKIIIGGPETTGAFIKTAYAPGGLREFDAKFMGRVYERPFTVEVTTAALVPPAREQLAPETEGKTRRLDGCRIGFDAGGSDRKVAAVREGKVVYSDEVIWHPKLQQDPQYHYDEILSAMQAAAAHLPRVDAIGVSAAGIYVNNRVMVASLFLKVPEDLFDKKIKDIFLNIQRTMGGVPLVVANDGDVTALAGAMDLQAVNVLGLAMGTSEAGGYIDARGNITGWLNELAFVPVDFNPLSAVDEWSGDYGCGVKYFSQEAVIKLAPAAGLWLDPALTPAEKLKLVQSRLAAGEVGARQIYESIGCYLGYAVAAYAEYYAIDHVLILGRVTSGEGGNIILDQARQVLAGEFPGLAGKIALHLPGEADRRMGQAVAAASLPELGGL